MFSPNRLHRRHINDPGVCWFDEVGDLPLIMDRISPEWTTSD